MEKITKHDNTLGRVPNVNFSYVLCKTTQDLKMLIYYFPFRLTMVRSRFMHITISCLSSLARLIFNLITYVIS